MQPACKYHHLVLLYLPIFQYCRVYPLHSFWGECEFLLVVSKIPIEPFLPRRCGCVCIYIENQLGEGPCPECHGAANRHFFLIPTHCEVHLLQPTENHRRGIWMRFRTDALLGRSILDFGHWAFQPCRPLGPAWEGTGTGPDYLVNQHDKKIEVPSGEKYCTEIEKSLYSEWSGL